jgi:REP element-mobilizing transposase RayT
MLPQRKPNRMKGYDYSRDNLYFVTSNVKDNIGCFGKIENGEMILNEYRNIAFNQGFWLAERYPYVILHAFVVMPNHIHGILEINSDDFTIKSKIKIKSLSELVGAYKTTTSKQIRLAGLTTFSWHRSFHDHIIRDATSIHNISNYINNNPSRWEFRE